MRDSAILAIVGKGPSVRLLEEYQAQGLREVWTLNDGYRHGVTTRHFDIHVPLGALTDLGRLAKDTPFMVRDPQLFGKSPGIELYPLEAVRQHFGWEAGREYIATTPAYMLALAIMWGQWQEIVLLGIDYDHRSRRESLWERPCVEWYMGWARAKGINVIVPHESNLLTTGSGLCRLPYGEGKCRRDDGFITWGVRRAS